MSDDFQNKLRHVYMGLGHILAELERNKTKINVRGGWWMWTIYEYVSSEYIHVPSSDFQIPDFFRSQKQQKQLKLYENKLCTPTFTVRSSIFRWTSTVVSFFIEVHTNAIVSTWIKGTWTSLIWNRKKIDEQSINLLVMTDKSISIGYRVVDVLDCILRSRKHFKVEGHWPKLAQKGHFCIWPNSNDFMSFMSRTKTFENMESL
jgi:hypothetical protein